MAYAPIRKSAARKLAAVRPSEDVGATLAAEMSATTDERAERLSLVVQDCQTAEEFVAEISRLWHQTKVRFLLIGQYLIAAKERLAHGEYEDFVKRQLPFGASTARQIRAVAEAVFVAHRLSADELPGSYSIAYQLVTMKDDVLAKAREQGLIHENVSRSILKTFKSNIRQAEAAPGSTGLSLEALLARKAALLDEIDRLESEVSEIDTLLLKQEGIIDGKAARR
jgi:hypothetical protein